MPLGPGNVGQVYAVAITPDGATIAAGGWTRGVVGEEQIYLFDRVTGAMTGRLGGLPTSVFHLAFSPEGARLAAVLYDGQGLRVHDRGGDGIWHEAWADSDYGDSSYGVAFGPEGRIATTSSDGKLRLYGADGALLAAVETSAPFPYGLAFNPVHGRLAVGFDRSPEVRIYHGETLAELSAPATDGIDNGDLSKIAWSADGVTLYAGGMYYDGSGQPILAWGEGGAGARRILPAGDNTLMSLKPLPNGALLAAAGDPWLGVITVDGASRWVVKPAQIDPRGQRHNLAVSEDGMLVEFGLNYGGEDRRRFDMAALKLLPPADDSQVRPPEQDSLNIADWVNSFSPTLDGAPLLLKRYEMSRSLAIHPQGESFVLGAEWYLRAFDAEGTELWRREAPGVVWAVNVTGDGRFALADYADGTLRWHRMEDGTELLALFPFDDSRNWVAWEPDGRFAATPGAMGALRWHVNKGWDEAPVALPARQVPHSFRPEVIKRVT